MSTVVPHSPRCDAEFELEADARAFMKACSEHGIAVEMHTRLVYRVTRSEAPAQPALPGVLFYQYNADETGDDCWDCILELCRLGVPVYLVPDLETDVSRTFRREDLGGLVLEVRAIDGDGPILLRRGRARGYLRHVTAMERGRL
jgi:hypothetical protein